MYAACAEQFHVMLHVDFFGETMETPVYSFSVVEAQSYVYDIRRFV